MPARHHDRAVFIPAPPEQVFAYVDDHSRFSSHMSESSWMMGRGRMSVEAGSLVRSYLLPHGA